MTPEFSLVLACYNEAPWLARCVEAILTELRSSGLTWELVFVDDASRDRTAEVIRELLAAHPGDPLRALFHDRNTGRGHAVADGMREAVGDVVGYLDVDLEIHPRFLRPCLEAVRAGADAAVGVRSFAFVPRHALRRVLGAGYAALIRLLLPVGDLKDTATGLKVFRKETAVPVVLTASDPHWFWDTEVMVRCRLAGLRIAQVPCVYVRNPAKPTTARLVHDAVVTLRALFDFRRTLARERKAGARA